MYLNVISFKNGKALSFNSAIPFSIDKLAESEAIVVTDALNGQILSFKSSEVVTIANAEVKDKPAKKRGFTAKVN